MVTTVTLSRGAVRMARKKVIVKRLSAIHDLGSMTVLCTDKTGTLTSAQIELAGSLAPDGKTNDRPAMLAAVCAQLGGDKGSLDEALTNARPGAHTGWSRRGLTPFDYRRRLGAVLADGPEGLTLIVKGAPEAVMEACASAGGAPFDAAARKACVGARPRLGLERPSRRRGRLTTVDGPPQRSNPERRNEPGVRGALHLRRPAKGQRAGGGGAARGGRRSGGDLVWRRSSRGRTLWPRSSGSALKKRSSGPT